MDTLTLKVRSDLRRYRQQLSLIYKDRWRFIQVVILGACLLLLSTVFLQKTWPTSRILPLLLFSPILILLSLSQAIKLFSKPGRQGLLLAVIFSCLSVAAGILHPGYPESQGDKFAWLTIFFPFITIPLFIRIFGDAPHLARKYSLRPYQPTLTIITGFFVGACLALHLYLVVRFIPTISNAYISFLPNTNLWFLGVLAGLVIPAEEMLFRGVVFSLHFDDIGNRFGSTAARIVVLNGVIYLVLMLYNLTRPDLLLVGILAVLYKCVLAYCSVYLIYRRRNLLAGFAANLIFTFLAGQIFFL